MPIAFVTGATGLLGSNLVHQLLEAGWTVRALVRSPAKAKIQMANLGVEIVEGDMERVADFAESLVGADVLFHTAAYFRDSYKGGSHWTQLHRINVEGTRALVQAAIAAKVGRMVHVSSTATVLPPLDSAGCEDDRRSVAQAADDYFRSKVMADLEIEQLLESTPEFWATFVLPGFMQGPGDLGPTSAGQMLLDFTNRKLPAVLDIQMSFVDARDVAHALIRAAEDGKRGRRYLVAGSTMHLRDVYRTMELVTKISAPKRTMPRWLLLGYAALSEFWARVTKRPVLLSWAGARSILAEAKRSNFDSSRAVRELGVEFRPLEESLRDSLQYFREQGMLPAATDSLHVHAAG